MACEWVKLTSQDSGNPIFVNLANAAVIEGHRGGSGIRFIAGEGYLDVSVSEPPEEILGSETANPT